MKKYYPELLICIECNIAFSSLVVLLSILLMVNELVMVGIICLILLCFLCFSTIMFAGTLSIQIDDNYIYYKRTCFSKTKKYNIKDLVKIKLHYTGNNKTYLVMNNGVSLCFDVNLNLIKNIMFLVSEKIVEVNCISKFSVPKRHREYLLTTKCLTKYQRKLLS